MEHKGTWGQENVFKSETLPHKCGGVQETKPNDSKVHFHFGSYIHVGVPNVQGLSWKGKQTPNATPRIPLERFWIVDT